MTNGNVNSLPAYLSGLNPECYTIGGNHIHCPRQPLNHFKVYEVDDVPVVPFFVTLADQFGISRFAVESSFYDSCQPIVRWRGPILARPAILQAGSARWRGGLASRLLILDSDPSDATFDLLDWA